MISVKSRRELDMMRRAGDILARCFIAVGNVIAEGSLTRDVDRVADEFIRSNGATPSFLGQKAMVSGAPDYPAAVCISVNNEVIHGMPGTRKFADGDIVSVDIGACYNGYHSDMARTFCVGHVRPEARRLVEVTEESFWQGLKGAVAGMRVTNISHNIQQHVEAAGFSVVREYVGHGIGSSLHESPQIPNYVDRRDRRGARLEKGMTLAIEPMVNAGGADVVTQKNNWTIVTKDGSLSAHYENTVLIGDDGATVLSVPF